MSRYASLVDAVWTDEAQLSRWITIETVVSRVIGHPIPPMTDSFATDELLTRTRTLEAKYGHDLAAFVEALRNWVRPSDSEAARWLHYGLCSSDVVDVGWMLAIRDATFALKTLVAPVIRALEHTTQHGYEVLYRTHGQAARVGLGNYRWDGWHDALIDVTGEMHRLIPFGVGFAGPTGTGGELTASQRQQIAAELGFQPRVLDGRQAADRTGWATWLAAVARVATACAQIALNLRLLSQTGIDEVHEGHGAEYRGSSSMPHKDNPTRLERICGLAPVIRGLASGYVEATSSCWDAHSLEHSSAERICFPQVTGLTGFALTELADVLGSLVIDHDAMARNVASAPADSYAERNRLIREGVDGGEAWSMARHVAVDLDRYPNRGDSVSPVLKIRDEGGKVISEAKLASVEGRTAYYRFETPVEELPVQLQDDEPMTIVATGTVTPGVAADDRDRGFTPPIEPNPDPVDSEHPPADYCF